MAAKVLLIDDSRLSRNVIKVHSMGHDIEFLEAHDGAQGLRLLEHACIDLVISDLNMPTMDGLAFLKHVRSSEGAIRSLPIVLLTGNKPFAETRQDCTRAGASECLPKPVSSANLFAVIEKYLPRARATR
jgi:CheY-like chemotaxis protein